MTTYHTDTQQTRGDVITATIGHNQFATSPGVDSSFDAAYTFLSGGKAQGFSFRSPVSGTIDAISFVVKRLDDAGVAWGTDTDGIIQATIHNNSNSLRIPGSVITNGVVNCTVGPSVDDEWFRQVIASSNPTLVAGNIYWIVFSDDDATASEYLTIHDPNNNSTGDDLSYGNGSAHTVNGWSSSGTADSYPPKFVIEISGGHKIVGSWNKEDTLTNNTNMKGLRFKVPYKCELSAVGITTGDDEDLYRIFDYKLFADADIPTDTPLITWTGLKESSLHSQGGPLHFFFDSTYTLEADTWYRLVLDPGATSISTPRKCVMHTGWDTTYAYSDFAPSDGNWHYTEENGSVWTDSTTTVPFMVIDVDLIAQAGGGGSVIIVEED